MFTDYTVDRYLDFYYYFNLSKSSLSENCGSNYVKQSSNLYFFRRRIFFNKLGAQSFPFVYSLKKLLLLL